MIAIIGGSGFIGTHLCQNLADRQVPFEIIDLKKTPRFPERTKIADIRDYQALRDAVTGNAIVNLAAVHRDDVKDRKQHYTTNVDGTRNVCGVAEEKGIDRIVFTSTVAVYVFAEPDTREDGPIKPFNDYGKSKFEGEEVLRNWFHTAPDQRYLTIVRPTVVFGEGNRGNVYNLLNQIASGRFVMIGNGKNRKSLAYVGNVAAFIETAVEKCKGYGLFNYVDKPDFNMNELVLQVRQELSGRTGVGLRLPYWLGLMLGYVVDAISYFTENSLPVSSIRVRKFCANTAFAGRASELNDFQAPYSLKLALKNALVAEFLNPNPNRDISLPSKLKTCEYHIPKYTQ